jgi:ABC-type Mn2+/Zn2+ transport system permease subunit
VSPSELVLSLGMAIASGLVGCFAVMRKMTLASDAIAHVALPGIGIALLLHVHPLLGGIAMLLLGTVLIWAVEWKTRIPTETVIGVVFSSALAIGGLLTEGEDLIEALFGQPGTLSPWEIGFGITGSIAVTVFVLRQRHRLVIALVSRDLARTSGIDVSRLSLCFLLAFSVTVTLGLRYLGVLLMGSLIIIPAATAKHLAANLNAMLALAVSIAVIATVTGMALAQSIQRDSGPVIIAVAAGIFFVGLLKRPA